MSESQPIGHRDVGLWFRRELGTLGLGAGQSMSTQPCLDRAHEQQIRNVPAGDQQNPEHRAEHRIEERRELRTEEGVKQRLHDDADLSFV